ncbi:7157_t:CDS:2, partial [Racocetra persica]
LSMVKSGGHDNANSYSNNAKNKRLWVALGRWLEMEEPVIRRDMRRYLRSKWIDLKYAGGYTSNGCQHFGTYTRNNLLPFTSSNTASSHNTAHQEYVNTLLHNLGPLSTSVNEFVRKFYGNLYEKLENDYHWDEHDEPNSLCCLVTLREFEGGELCFPRLQIIILLQPGQVVAFSLRFLLHSNFSLTKSIRYSIVYFVHDTFFHNLRKFDDVYDDLKDRIEKNADGHDVLFIKHQNLNNAQAKTDEVPLEPNKSYSLTSSKVTTPPMQCSVSAPSSINTNRPREGNTNKLFISSLFAKQINLLPSHLNLPKDTVLRLKDGTEITIV